MNSPSATADSGAGLTPAQRDTLRTVIGMLVPASADARLPPASGLPQVVADVEHAVAGLPLLRESVALLHDEAIARQGAAFAAQDPASRSKLLDEFAARHPAALQRLGLETVTSYYQQDRVIEELGLEARPPFPAGYQVIAGDLTLLNPVIARGRIYRDAP